MKLDEAVDLIVPVFAGAHRATGAIGLNAAEVSRTEPRECRSGLNERNGTAQVRLSYTVVDLDRAGADRLVQAVATELEQAGAAVEVGEESDLDRPSLRAERGEERYNVTFAFGDGGTTATVSGATGCHEMTG